MPDSLAPVSIPLYKRKDHLERCIRSLRSSPLAKSTILYLFSDYPRPGDEIEVKALRDSILNIDGFRDVIIVERESNMGIDNVVDAIEFPLKKHGAVIYLEEDIVVAPNFLEFVNSALIYYKESKEIFSITGFTMPCSVDKRSQYVKATSVFNAWGCALWYEKYGIYKKYLNDGLLSSRLKSSLWLSIRLIYWHSFAQYWTFLKKDSEMRLTPDMQMGFYIWANGLLQAFPSQSLVKNGGMDGSGWNCGVTDKFNHSDIWPESDATMVGSFSPNNIKKDFFKIRRYHGLGFLNDLRIIAKLLLPEFILRHIRAIYHK